MHPVPDRQILVVDDNQNVCDALACLLEDDATVTTITAAVTALRLLASRVRVDLLITDIDLGGVVTGLELCAAAVHYRPSLRTIVFSGDLSEQTRRYCDEHALPFVSKGESASKLRETALAMLSAHNSV